MADPAPNHAPELALSYAAAGLRVFPTDGKRPRVSSWPADATTDAERIRGWWSRWPRAGVGWCLPAGVVVADIDPPDGSAYAKAAGGLPHHAPIASTPRRGWHIVMALPDAGPWAQRQLAPSVDARVGGLGYICLPDGSDGRSWRWPNGLPLSALVDPTLLPPAPEWVVERVRDRPRPETDPDAPRRGDDDARRALRDQILTAELADGPLVPNDRHATFLRVGRHLRGLGADADELLAAVERLNVQRGAPPKAGREWEAERGGLVEWLMEIEPDVVEDGVGDVTEGASPAGDWLEPEDRGTAQLTPLGGKAYIEDMVRPSRALVVASTEGVGKTSAMVGEAAIRIAVAGGEFAGTWPVPEQRPVLVMSEQHTDDDFRREERVLAALGRTRSDLAGRYYRLPLMTAAGDRPALMAPAWRSWITSWMRDRGVAVLMIDTATGATLVDPWGREIQGVYRALRAMMAAYPELAIVLLVHMRKPSGRGARGIDDVLGEWGRWNDVTLTLEADGPERVKLTTYKRVDNPRRIVAVKRNGLLVEPVEVGPGHGAQVPDARVLAVVAEKAGQTYAELGKALDISARTARSYCRRLADGGRVRLVLRPGKPTTVLPTASDGVGQVGKVGNEHEGIPPAGVDSGPTSGVGKAGRHPVGVPTPDVGLPPDDCPAASTTNFGSLWPAIHERDAAARKDKPQH
jgi:hypothetical protein